MGIQIQSQLFKWLQSLGIVKEGKRNSNNLVELTQQNTIKLFDGYYIGSILKNFLKTDQEGQKKLQAIKENSTPAIRLYNWNIITQILKRIKYALDYTEKSKILNLETQPLLRILRYLYTLRTSQTKEQNKPLQVDITQVGKKSIRDSLNILQFFVISISKNFKLSPQHTLNLFLDNNKYLAHLLVKGVKNSFQPIYLLLNDIKDNLDFIIVTLFCTDQKESAKFFLNALKPCSISKDGYAAQLHIQILIEFYNLYKINSIDFTMVKNWLKQQGLNTLFFGLKRHQGLFKQIISTTYLFLEQQLFDFIQPTDKSVIWSDQKEKLVFYKNFLVVLTDQGIQKFQKSATIQMWSKFCVKVLKKNKDNLFEIMGVLELIWLRIPTHFHQQESDLPNLFLGFLKSASVSNSSLLFHQSIRVMFTLMQVLGTRKNQQAPFIYKILTSCFSFLSDDTRIAYLSSNFAQAYKAIPNLPGGPIIEPLIKSLERGVILQCLQLSKIILEQNRITQSQIVQLMQIFTKIIFHDYQYGTICLQYLFETLKVVNQQLNNQFLQRNSQLCLSHYYSVSKSITRSLEDLISDFKRYGQDDNMKKGSNSLTDQMSKHINLGNLVQFMKNSIYTSQDAKQSFQPFLFHTYVKIKRQLNKKKQAELLLPLMKYYYRMDTQLNQKIQQYQDQQYPPPPSPPQRDNSTTMIKSADHITPNNQQKTIKPLDLTTLRPAISALKQLERIKKKKQDMRTLDQKNKKQQDIIQQKKQMFRSLVNQKRIIDFGVKSKNNMEYRCIYDWETMKDQDNLLGMPVIRMLNLVKEQQDPFLEDADAIMKKYRKIWRFLFFKYSSFGAIKKQQFTKTQQKIHMAQIWKMLKQYNVNIVKKQQSHTLVRQVNQSMKRRNDLQYLTYLGFQEYILQVCTYGYSKSGYPQLPPGQHMMLFVNQLKKVTTQKGGSIDLFQNPQEVYFQETDVIKQFNKRLKQNPQYILPQGYKKVKQCQLEYDYQIHPMNQRNIQSSYIDVFQVLDSIFSQKLGFRIIQPLTTKKEKYLAKPALFQKINQKMKDYKNGYLAPKRAMSTADRKKRQNPNMFKPQFHPLVNFSLGIKLGLANVGVTNRYIAEEVAYWMDDMLDAIQNKKLKVGNKAKKRIDNQVLRKRRVYTHKIKQKKKQQQIKWRQRSVSVKVQAQVFRQKKNNNNQKKIIKKTTKKSKKIKIIIITQKKIRRILTSQKKIRLKKISRKNEKNDGIIIEKKRKIIIQKRCIIIFQKKKQQLQQKQSIIKKNKDDQKQKQKLENQRKQKMFKNLHYSILKKQQTILEKVAEIKQVYQDTWLSKTIQNQLINYQIPLKYLFDLLLKYQKSKISATNYDEIGLNTLHFFALKFKIVPFMIQKNTLAKIFTVIGRDAKKGNTTMGISFQGFKQVLFRVTVKSKELLNGIIEKKKNKQLQYSQFLSKQSSSGNHFEVQDIPDNSQIKQEEPKSKKDLTDEYLFDATGVTGQTVKQMFDFLNLPKDKPGVQQRYRDAIQSKNNKPKNLLIKQLKNSFE